MPKKIFRILIHHTACKICFTGVLYVFFVLLITTNVFPQVDNISINNPVYDFLKSMSVKKIIENIHDDDPVLSRGEIEKYLNVIDKKSLELSNTERKILKKYKEEFLIDSTDFEKADIIFGNRGKFMKRIENIFSNKEKYLYVFRKGENNLYLSGGGHIGAITEFEPNSKRSSMIFDGGVWLGGTLFGKLGYNLKFLKGAASGTTSLSPILERQIKYSYLYNKPRDNINSYDIFSGYLRFYSEITEDMNLAVQIGREPMKYGFGYSYPLVLSNNGPDMDFIKFSFNYGILNFSSVHAATVGNLYDNVNDRFTKYFAAHRLRFSFPDIFDIGIGEGVIYAKRGIEIGYLTPFTFYKGVEMALQDRDNGIFFLEFQTHFIKNIEFQGTYFIDEDIFSHLQNFERYSNKTAYQLGTYIYEPLGFSNFSLIFEYTKIRPYVYSHYYPENTYTAYGEILGNPIGPNADQIFIKAGYDFSDWLSVYAIYSKTRKGMNIIDSAGVLVKNVGGNVNQPFREGIDNEQAKFLDGERINTHRITLNIRIEPLRNFIFDLNYTYYLDKYFSGSRENKFSFGYLKFTLDL